MLDQISADFVLKKYRFRRSTLKFKIISPSPKTLLLFATGQLAGFSNSDHRKPISLCPHPTTRVSTTSINLKAGGLPPSTASDVGASPGCITVPPSAIIMLLALVEVAW